MEFVFEILFEFIYELLCEGLLNLYRAFLPSRVISPTAYKVVKAIAVIVSVLMFVLLFVGVILLIDTKGKSALGWVFVSAYAVYIILAIVVKIISIIKNG